MKFDPDKFDKDLADVFKKGNVSKAAKVAKALGENSSGSNTCTDIDTDVVEGEEVLEEVVEEVPVESNITLIDSMLNNSRISPSGNGSDNTDGNCTVPNSAQKWWAAIFLGFIFAVISCPAAYFATSALTVALGGLPLTDGAGPNFAGLLLHTLIFIAIVRLILW
jgi:hypothetical protein